MPLEQIQTTLHVSGLSEEVTPQTLYSMFIPFGEIVRVELPRDENLDIEDEPHQGFGYVEFKEEGDAWDAIDNMDQSEAFGRILHVTRARAEKAILEGLGSKIPVWEQEAWIQRYQVDKDDWKAVEQQKIMQSTQQTENAHPTSTISHPL
ncbi:uncharacterized protein T551_00772 [Pneumocystis jirovecii RU7]|uniref:RRM domain-containing protein n=1 Tax=Pneumocystis jirovecii (strain RU7) TaxID=1408657 RepID=A0A0W4ZUP4_PNEJ7|nr:uncharacterized protein T551_00772 [Pneumocystis jirovecii RU7]KTW32090.1 hypothetical protein T551_00772 [Pneumocystis jirovecii RU7]